ncbi:MAG: histidine phosphatase family protein, partial [Limisphaerales bacterium]
MTHLYLIRHGEIEPRYHRVFGGRIDMNLSPQGELQTQALSNYLSKIKFEAIYASPMRRAQQTVAPLMAAYKFQATVLPDLREVDFGDWTGLSWQEVHDKFQISAFSWLEMMEQAAVPKGESSRSFRARIEPCLKEILEKNSGKTIGVVCHGGVIRMLLSILLDLPLPKMGLFEIEYASITQVDYT